MSENDGWEEGWSDSLERSFGPSGEAHLERTVNRALGSLDEEREPGTWRRAMAVAAALLILGMATLIVTSQSATAHERIDQWVSTYRTIEANRTDQCTCAPACCEAAEACIQRLAERLEMGESGGLALRDSCCVASEDSPQLVADCADCALCLFVVEAEDAPAISESEMERDGIRIHRRDLGSVVAFELSRLEEPRLLVTLDEDERY
ncbi:MAG: hypothetical protein AAGG01_16435 [Planctomycetota bacterium]